MNFILSIIKFIKVKPIIKFKKFECHNYAGSIAGSAKRRHLNYSEADL